MFHEKIMNTRIQNASLEKFQSIATSKLHIETYTKGTSTHPKMMPSQGAGKEICTQKALYIQCHFFKKKSPCNSLPKGGFFQKVRFVFQISKSQKKNIPKNYPELEI